MVPEFPVLSSPESSPAEAVLLNRIRSEFKRYDDQNSPVAVVITSAISRTVSGGGSAGVKRVGELLNSTTKGSGSALSGHSCRKGGHREGKAESSEDSLGEHLEELWGFGFGLEVKKWERCGDWSGWNAIDVMICVRWERRRLPFVFESSSVKVEVLERDRDESMINIYHLRKSSPFPSYIQCSLSARSHVSRTTQGPVVINKQWCQSYSKIAAHVERGMVNPQGIGKRLRTRQLPIVVWIA